MSGNTCDTCAYSTRRLRGSRPRLWCKAYHQPAVMTGCIDYRKRVTIASVLGYLKRTSLK